MIVNSALSMLKLIKLQSNSNKSVQKKCFLTFSLCPGIHYLYAIKLMEVAPYFCPIIFIDELNFMLVGKLMLTKEVSWS